jgi:hypothetical protein
LFIASKNACSLHPHCSLYPHQPYVPPWVDDPTHFLLLQYGIPCHLKLRHVHVFSLIVTNLKLIRCLRITSSLHGWPWIMDWHCIISLLCVTISFSLSVHTFLSVLLWWELLVVVYLARTCLILPLGEETDVKPLLIDWLKNAFETDLVGCACVNCLIEIKLLLISHRIPIIVQILHGFPKRLLNNKETQRQLIS